MHRRSREMQGRHGKMVLNQSINLEGIVVPLSTPIREDNQKIDFKATNKHIQRLTSKGIRKIFPLSATGEFPHFSLEESRDFVLHLSAYTKSLNSNVEIYAGVFMNNTPEKIEFAKKSEGLVDGIVLMPPYYYQRIPDEGIIDQVRRVKESTCLPIIFYNTKSRVRVSEEGMLKMFDEGLIVGAKEGSHDLEYLARLAKRMPILPGSDSLIYKGSQIGCKGGVPGSANVLTSGFVRLWDLIKSGQLEEAEKLQERLSAVKEVMYKASPYGAQIGVKIGLEYLGICSSTMRSPMPQPTQEEKDKVFKVLEENKDLL